MLYEMIHLGCTDQTQATVHLVIVLPRIQKSGTGDDNFLNGKERRMVILVTSVTVWEIIKEP